MKFSILTPSYGYARFLPTAVESVLIQRVDQEHIVCDGGSQDGTVEFLRTCPDTVRWVSEPDHGQSDALNKAFSRASGDIIGWLNADDFYLPGALEAVAEIFTNNPHVDVVYGDTLFVDEVGQFTGMLGGYQVPPSVLKRRGCVITSTTSFFRSQALAGVTWDPELRLVMDWDLFLTLIGRGAVLKHVAEPLAAFRLHGAQVTNAPFQRDSDEHQRVRSRHGIETSSPRLTNLIGDVHHAALKRLSGARKRERAAADWRGTRLIDESGRISISPLDSLLGALRP